MNLSTVRLSATLLVSTCTALAGVVAAGCSSSADEGNQPQPSNAAQTGDGGLGASSSGYGADGAASQPEGPVKTGFVTLAQTKQSSLVTYAATAAFVTSPRGNSGSEASCKVSTEGACQVTTCTMGTSDAGVSDAAAAGPTSESAGIVTLSGGKLASAVKLTPGAQNAYAPANGTSAAFAAGDSVKVSAEGATVPAFEATAVAPGDITVTAPVFASFQTSFSKSKDLALSWTGGAAGNVNVALSTYGAKLVSVLCTFPANAGAGTVPAAALTDLDPSGPLGASISILPSVTSTVTAGDYKVTYTLSGTGAAGTFTLK